jgi:ABC-type multidrug transport system fused ATPase/permease subunit
MSWGTIFQMIFFINTALLAIVITVFVFASSLLGRAIEINKKQKQKYAEQQQDLMKDTIKSLDESLKSLKENKASSKEIIKAQETLKKQQKQYNKLEKKKKGTDSQFNMFTVNKGIGMQSGLFFLSAVVSGIAWSIFSNSVSTVAQNPKPLVTGIYLVITCGLMLIGICGFYRLLVKIQEIAITTEEASLKMMINAFKTAQKEIMNENRPVLALTIENEIPLKTKIGQIVQIECMVHLKNGDAGRNTVVTVIAPIGSEFQETKGDKGIYPANATIYKNQPFCSFSLPTLTTDRYHPVEVKIKVPTKVNTYELILAATCEGNSIQESIPLVVE